jgi:hypothetical protein
MEDKTRKMPRKTQQITIGREKSRWRRRRREKPKKKVEKKDKAEEGCEKKRRRPTEARYITCAAQTIFSRDMKPLLEKTGFGTYD